MGTPVRVSFPFLMVSPASASPRKPCSGANTFLFVYALPAGCPTDEFLLPWRFGLQPMLHASLLI